MIIIVQILLILVWGLTGILMENHGITNASVFSFHGLIFGACLAIAR